MKTKIILLSLILLISWFTFSQKLVTYKASSDADMAYDYTIRVNGEEVEVYQNKWAAFAYFSFEGKAHIEIGIGCKVFDAEIRPINANIGWAIEANDTLSINITQPCNLSIEINKNIKRPLFIFANPIEKNIPLKTSKVKYFEGGKIYNEGIINLHSNETVYIEGGAIVKGCIIANDVKNAKILGRGILDGGIFKKGEQRTIELNQCDSILVEGIIVTNSGNWSTPMTTCRNINYSNIKIISGSDKDDGIDIIASQNINIDGCFIRSKNDCIAIKSGINYVTKLNTQINVENIKITNCVLWNAELGNGLEIGTETRCDTIKNILFQNCDLIHVFGHEGTFAIHNGDRAVVTDINYNDIRVEDSRGYLIDMKILKSEYSKDRHRGKIQNIHFKNIKVYSDSILHSTMTGFDENHKIENVVLEDVRIKGVLIRNTKEAKIKTEFTDNLTFINTPKKK